MLKNKIKCIESIFSNKLWSTTFVSLTGLFSFLIILIHLLTSKTSFSEWVLFLTSTVILIYSSYEFINGIKSKKLKLLFPVLGISDAPIREIYGFFFVLVGLAMLIDSCFLIVFYIVLITLYWMTITFNFIRKYIYFINVRLIIYFILLSLILYTQAPIADTIITIIILGLLVVPEVLHNKRNKRLMDLGLIVVIGIALYFSILVLKSPFLEDNHYRLLLFIFIILIIRLIYSIFQLAGKLPEIFKSQTLVHRTFPIFVIVVFLFISFAMAFFSKPNSSNGSSNSTLVLFILVCYLFTCCILIYMYIIRPVLLDYPDTKLKTPTNLIAVFGTNWKVVTLSLSLVFIYNIDSVVIGMVDDFILYSILVFYFLLIFEFSMLFISPNTADIKSSTAKINTDNINDVLNYPTILPSMIAPISLDSVLISFDSKDLIPQEHKKEGEVVAFATLDTEYCFINETKINSNCKKDKINVVVNCEKKLTYYIDEVRYAFKVGDDYYMGYARLIIKVALIQTEVILTSFDIKLLTTHMIRQREYDFFDNYAKSNTSKTKFKFNRLLNKYRFFKENEFKVIPPKLNISIDSRKFLLNNGKYGAGKSVFDIVSINREGYNPLPISLWEENYSSELLFVLHNRLKTVSKTIYESKTYPWQNKQDETIQNRVRRVTVNKRTGNWWNVQKKVPWLSVVGLTTVILVCLYKIILELNILFPNILIEFKRFLKSASDVMFAQIQDGSPASFIVNLYPIKNPLINRESSYLLLWLFTTLIILFLSKRLIIQYRIHKTNSTEFFQDYFLADIRRILIQKNAVIIFEDVDRMDVEDIKKVFRLVSNLNKYMKEEERIVGVISLDLKVIKEKYDKEVNNEEYKQELEKICFNFESNSMEEWFDKNKKDYFRQLLKFTRYLLNNTEDMDISLKNVLEWKLDVILLNENIQFKKDPNFRTLRKLSEQITKLDSNNKEDWKTVQKSINNLV